MIKSGIVMDVKDKFAFILTSTGIFAKVKIKGTSPTIGEIYSGRVSKSLNLNINLKFLLTLMFMLVTTISIFLYYIPTNEVSINIDSEVKLTTNYFGLITNYDTSDDATKILLRGVKIKNISLSNGLINIINESKKHDIINSEFINSNKEINVNIKNLKSKKADLSNFKSIIKTETFKVNISNISDAPHDITNISRLDSDIANKRMYVNKKDNAMPFKPTLLKVNYINKYDYSHSSSELSSIMMMLNYAGVNTDYDTLISMLPKDTTPLKLDENNNIESYGDPSIGLVGDISNKISPYIGVYPAPLMEVFNKFVSDKSVNLSKCNFFELTKQLDDGNPVMVWTTNSFTDPVKFRIKWTSGNNEIEFPYGVSNTIVITGYDDKFIYYNDPSSGTSKIDTNKFIENWKKCGSYAISYNIYKKINKINNNSSDINNIYTNKYLLKL